MNSGGDPLAIDGFVGIRDVHSGALLIGATGTTLKKSALSLIQKKRNLS
jgi:hypothetical protein